MDKGDVSFDDIYDEGFALGKKFEFSQLQPFIHMTTDICKTGKARVEYTTTFLSQRRFERTKMPNRLIILY